MLSQNDLPLRIIDQRAFIDFLGAQDEPWVRVLLSEVRRCEGQRQRQLAERLAEPLPCEAPYFKRRAASRVLMRLWRGSRESGARGTDIRQVVFRAAAATGAPRERVLDETAAAFQVTRPALEAAWFGDLPGERVVSAPAEPPGPAEVILRTNLAVAQAVLMRASRLDLRVEGGVRPVVRLAKLRGLLCVIKISAADAAPVLELSGPFALFRHTLLYGRALAELLPHLAWCARFELEAQVSLRGRLCDVTLDQGAPIFPAARPRAFDSRLEERFAADFAAIAADWDLVREPEAVRAGDTLIFPDFLARHRLHPGRRALIEIIGFWTPDYLQRKLEHARTAEVGPLILCLDEERACPAADLPPGVPVIRYRRRVDAQAVLQVLEAVTAG